MPNILFFLKKVVLFLFYPSSLIFFFLFLVSIYVILDKRRGRRRLLLFLAIFLYYLSTTPFLPYFMLKHLEKKYKVPPASEIQKCKKIVVLTGRIYGEKGLSLEERFSRETLIRFLKGIDLKKKYPEKELIVLGGSYEDKHYKGATYLKELAEKLGYNVTALDAPLDTITSAKVLKNYLSNSTGGAKQPFLLLTSAYHLPRAIFLFKKQGLNPIPYPTNYNYKLCKPRFSIFDFLPNDLYLTFTNLAFHEYLGLIFYKLKYAILR